MNKYIRVSMTPHDFRQKEDGKAEILKHAKKIQKGD
jgi:hypothetical protein